MREFIIFFALLLGVAARPGLRAKFNIGLRPGTDFFYDIPRHIDDAVAKDWTLLERPEGPLPSLVMYCADERVICSLYDPVTRFVAGVQIGLPLNEFTGAVFSWDVQGYVPWIPPAIDGAEIVTYMTKLMLFVSEETLSRSREERQTRETEVLQEDAVWVMGFNRELLKIPTSTSELEKTDFTKQSCIPWMGRHYYYNMTSETECTADKILNWFPLVHSGKLNGMGFLSFGVLPEKKDQRFWFERPPRLAVQAIVPDGPECLYDLADNPTITTMHIYFVDQPWFLGCLLN